MKNTFLLFLLLALSSAAVKAQTTTFTYQGRLSDSSVAANGQYDLQFTLFFEQSGGTQLGSSITRSNVAVTNGIFTVQLDFGGLAFLGTARRFLQISVKRPGETDFTTLAPRQELTAAPYAIRAAVATTADTATTATDAQQLGGTAANQFTQNDSQAFVRNQTTQQTADFNVSGTGAANIFSATTQYNIGGNRILSNPGTGNLFAGVNAGTNNTGFANSFVGTFAGFNSTTGNRNSFVGTSAGQANTTGSINSFIGSFAGNSNTTGSGNSFVGAGAGFYNTTGGNNTLIGVNADVGADNLMYAAAIGSGATVSTSNTVVLGRTLDTVIAPNTLQVNTLGAAGSTSLCRNSSNQISTCTAGNRADTNQFAADKIDRLDEQVKQQADLIKQQQSVIDGLKKLVCAGNPNADVCR